MEVKKETRVIHLDVRIDNRNALYDQLGIEKAVTDETLLLFAYQRWGSACAEKLIGDFAFVLYDASEERYFCARDPLGIKPLYYAVSEGRCFFAGDIETLFQTVSLPKTPNTEAMASWLNQLAIAYDATMYREIKRLPPGHWMGICRGKRETVRYWKPEKITINRTISYEEAQQRFRELFEQSIRDRVEELESTAFELSGGLDSSSIVSFLGKKGMKPRVYALRFGALDCDEGEYIEAVAGHYGLEVENIHADRIDVAGGYDLAFNYRANPHWPILGTFTIVFPMVEKMKEAGMKVIITGQGGDHILTGSLWSLTEQLKRFRLLSVADELCRVDHPLKVIRHYLLAPLLGERQKKVLRFLLRRPKREPIPHYPSLTDRMALDSEAFREDLKLLMSTRQSMVMDYAPFCRIEKQYGLEYRHPFYDLRLVEFMLSLPPEFKYRRGKKKALLRDVMRGILPEKVRLRNDKAEFSNSVRREIDAVNLDTLLRKPYIVALGLIEQEKIDSLRKAYREGTLKNILSFWQIINLEYWYRHTFVGEK